MSGGSVQSKKQLIRKMAAAALFVVAVAGATAVFTWVVSSGAREERLEERRSQRARAVDEARSYLADLAAQITAVPVDPTIVGEVQARHFEDILQGRRYVWGVGPEGEFLFGVPQADFARLNAAWDAHETSIVAEGVVVDRQDFLRRLVHASDSHDFLRRLARASEEVDSDLEEEEYEREETPWSGLRYYGDRDDWMVFSSPLRAADGSGLGNLYLKMETADRGWEPWDSDPAENLFALAGSVGGFATAFLWFLLPTWVYVDARERGVRRAMLWSFLVLISVFVGLVVYLIARPEETILKCPGCEREVNGGAFCPHCGRDLSSAFCATCRYPLKPDWAFCPSCRTEIGRPTEREAPDPGATTPEQGVAPPPEEG